MISSREILDPLKKELCMHVPMNSIKLFINLMFCDSIDAIVQRNHSY